MSLLLHSNRTNQSERRGTGQEGHMRRGRRGGAGGYVIYLQSACMVFTAALQEKFYTVVV